MARSTEQVLLEHVDALLRGDFPAMMADYADDAVLMTMNEANVGKEAIQGYFIRSLSAMPNAVMTPTGHKVHGDSALFTWTMTSDVAELPAGVDTFVIKDDKILLQTVWYMVVPKQPEQ